MANADSDSRTFTACSSSINFAIFFGGCSQFAGFMILLARMNHDSDAVASAIAVAGFVVFGAVLQLASRRRRRMLGTYVVNSCDRTIMERTSERLAAGPIMERTSERLAAGPIMERTSERLAAGPIAAKPTHRRFRFDDVAMMRLQPDVTDIGFGSMQHCLHWLTLTMTDGTSICIARDYRWKLEAVVAQLHRIGITATGKQPRIPTARVR
jgi:hypothetical protein